MALLIDGYNLLHVFGTGRGPGGFQRSREALIGFLAASIDDAHRRTARFAETIFARRHNRPLCV